MGKSVSQMTGYELLFLPGPLCVQPEMLPLLGYEPCEGSSVIKSCTLVWLWTVGPDDVESVNPAPAPATLNVLCHSVLISLAKAETPLIRFALEIRDPEILVSCYLFLLTRAVLFWPTTVNTRIHSHMHIYPDI